MKEIIKFNKISKNLEKKYDKKITRTLKDMKNYYDKNEVKKILKKRNPIIYQVFIKKIGKLSSGLTVINPGSIGKEYYFTKGHKHKKPSPELYILTEGKGRLITQNKTCKIITLNKNKVFTVPKTSAHRLVNIGNKKLKVLTIYETDTGHDYNIKFKKRLLKK
jgi:glucose-6-phosphate isomerase